VRIESVISSLISIPAFYQLLNPNMMHRWYFYGIYRSIAVASKKGQTFPRFSIGGENRSAWYIARHLNLWMSRGRSLFASRESDLATWITWKIKTLFA